MLIILLYSQGKYLEYYLDTRMIIHYVDKLWGISIIVFQSTHLFLYSDLLVTIVSWGFGRYLLYYLLKSINSNDAQILYLPTIIKI